MSPGPLLIHCLCIMNDGDEPEAVTPDVENDVSVDVVGILKYVLNFSKIVPSNAFDDYNPGSYLVRSIWILLHRLAEMLARNNVVHCPTILHNT